MTTSPVEVATRPERTYLASQTSRLPSADGTCSKPNHHQVVIRDAERLAEVAQDSDET